MSSVDEIGLKDLERWYDIENKDGGIILDLRWNVGGIYEASTLERMFRSVSGFFVTGNTSQYRYPVGSSSANRVILMNGYTQSSAEGVCIGGRSNGAHLLGTNTWGGYSSGGIGFRQVDNTYIQVTTHMWGDDTGIGYIENKGVIPDQLVENNFDIQQDNQLEAAVQYLLGQEFPSTSPTE